jgi:hypothetical protein
VSAVDPQGSTGQRTGAPWPAWPSARPWPGRALVRDVRLVAEPGRLVLVRAGRPVRTLTVGPGAEVEQAVHLGGPLLKDVAPMSLGAIDLLAADGRRVARLDLRDWVPEALELSRAGEALRRSGLRPLLEHAGLALRPIAPSEFAAAVDALPDSLLPGGRLPWAYTVLRSAAIVLAVVTVLVARATQEAPGWLSLTAALTLLASTGTALALWVVAGLRDRAGRASGPVLVPRFSAPVTRRFLRTARLRLEPEAVVVVDALGRERRLPRTGPEAVTSVAVVRSGTARAQVELRSNSGLARATLPADRWIGAGTSELVEACAAAGLPLDTVAAPASRPAVEEEAARAVFSVPDRSLVQRATWPSGVPGPAAVWQTTIFAVLLLIAGIAEEPPAGVRVLLGVTVALALGPHLVRLAVRRWLDREVRPS